MSFFMNGWYFETFWMNVKKTVIKNYLKVGRNEIKCLNGLDLETDL